MIARSVLSNLYDRFCDVTNSPAPSTTASRRLSNLYDRFGWYYHSDTVVRIGKHTFQIYMIDSRLERAKYISERLELIFQIYMIDSQYCWRW